MTPAVLTSLPIRAFSVAVATAATAWLSACGPNVVRSCSDAGPPEVSSETLANAPTCPMTGIRADPQVVTARLTPSGWPFLVRSVSYLLSGGDEARPSGFTCDHRRPHDLLLWRGTGDAPTSEPEILRRFVVTDLEGGETAQTVVRPLDVPIELEEGESLFVGLVLPSVQLPPDTLPVALCAGVCATPEGGESDFCSRATEPPYLWSACAIEGMGSSLVVEASGDRLDGEGAVCAAERGHAPRGDGGVPPHDGGPRVDAGVDGGMCLPFGADCSYFSGVPGLDCCPPLTCVRDFDATETCR